MTPDRVAEALAALEAADQLQVSYKSCGGRLYVEARGQTVVVDILNGSRRDAVTERTV